MPVTNESTGIALSNFGWLDGDGMGFIDQSAFFIPIPAAFAPETKFGCPDVGSVFTYKCSGMEY
jgi:hypothetical protein